MQRALLILALTLGASTGCVDSRPGVVPAGEDTFLASRTGAFYVPITDLKAQVLAQAGQYCDNQKKTFEIIDSNQTLPPYSLGPAVEVHFRCIDRQP